MDATTNVDVIQNATKNVVDRDAPSIRRTENNPITFIDFNTVEPFASRVIESRRTLFQYQTNLGLILVFVARFIRKDDAALRLFGTNVDSNQHLHYDVPHILIGGAGGKLKGGRHLGFKTKTVTTGNLMQSILGMYDIKVDKFGDGDGPLQGLV